MTVEMPETLYALGNTTPQDPLVAAINRLAQAVEVQNAVLVEQMALAKLDTPPAFAPLPRMQPILAPATVCPTHNAPWKIVPAGVSRRTGQTYESFAACPVQGCDQRPPR